MIRVKAALRRYPGAAADAFAGIDLELEPGTTFAGQFRVVRKLAQGGMGAVYVAEQIATGRQRALKLMHPGLVSSRDLRDKFTLVARVGAKIASEHVVEVVAAGVDPTSGSPTPSSVRIAASSNGDG